MHFMTRTVCYRLCHTQTVTPTMKWLTVWHGCGFIGTLLAIMMQVALTQTDHAWDRHMFMFGPAHNSLLRPTSGYEGETLSPSCAWVLTWAWSHLASEWIAMRESSSLQDDRHFLPCSHHLTITLSLTWRKYDMGWWKMMWKCLREEIWIVGDIKRKLDKGRKRPQGGVNLLMLTHNARWSSLLDPGLVSSDPVTM